MSIESGLNGHDCGMWQKLKEALAELWQPLDLIDLSRFVSPPIPEKREKGVSEKEIAPILEQVGEQAKILDEAIREAKIAKEEETKKAGKKGDEDVIIFPRAEAGNEVKKRAA
jgi:hypothetical protein